MRVLYIFVVLVVSVAAAAQAVTATHAERNANTAVFWESDFPSSDTSAVTRAQITSALPGTALVSADDLAAALLHIRTLVWPYGSAFPEPAWAAIYAFLQRGGNLVAIGGRPFTRPAFRDANGVWRLREENYAFARALNLIEYQQTPSSARLQVVANEDLVRIQPFTWTNAWSLVVRLSDEDTSAREGSAGRNDARLTPLVWGEREGHKLAAPVVQIDHVRGKFIGGRWIIASADLTADFLRVIQVLVTRAADSAQEFRVEVGSPLLLPAEPIRLHVIWNRKNTVVNARRDASVLITVKPEHGKVIEKSVALSTEQGPVSQWIELGPSGGSGFHTVTVTLTERGIPYPDHYRTGFWIRDLDYLRSGPRLTVDPDYFQLDGRPLPVVGTTYMASDVQRLFFAEPNPYVWDRDMEQIAANGMNMLRTGWWSGWDDLVENGVATEHTLRTMEAFLMTARRHNLPVQWTLFAFMPDVLGGGNPYVSPEAVRREKDFVTSVAERFKGVPFVAWDLINEPSFDNPDRFWSTRPNGDAAEREAWTQWLGRRYGTDENRVSAWQSLAQPGGAPLPEDRDFMERSAYVGGHPVASYDFHLFAQEKFAEWAAMMRDAIRATGSSQMITVGQDEGGGADRASPAFFAPAVDFTTTHTWWLNDALLWDSLVAKAPGKPMLTQETGFQREWGLDGRPRRDAASEAAVLEQKIAAALGTGAGAMQWLWNVNAWMTSEQEVTIGAIRPDETEKPETEVMRRFASFAASARDHFRGPESPEVAIVTSQALQYSVLGNAAVEAQQRAVRVVHYDLHVPAYVVTENNISTLGRPKLVILPSPQALSDAAWRKLIEYVNAGGRLLITGSVERDDHWRQAQRLRDLGIDASPVPLTFRSGDMTVGDSPVTAQFAGQRQLTLEALRMANGWSEKQVGKGTIFVAAYPVELADGPDPARALYSDVLKRSGIQSPFEGDLPSGVLARPVVFADAVLYLLLSESGSDRDIDIKDRLTTGRVRLHLPAQRAALILLDRRTGAVLANSASSGPRL